MEKYNLFDESGNTGTAQNKTIINIYFKMTNISKYFLKNPLTIKTSLARNLATISSNSLKNVPASVRIVEVGPRDGLQNEKGQVPTEVKLEFISKLAKSGLKYIEATSFVSPKWVPQVRFFNSVWHFFFIRKNKSFEM